MKIENKYIIDILCAITGSVVGSCVSSTVEKMVVDATVDENDSKAMQVTNTIGGIALGALAGTACSKMITGQWEDLKNVIAMFDTDEDDDSEEFSDEDETEDDDE